MPYTLANDGDSFEKAACRHFRQHEFPAYEEFWRRQIVPMTNPPRDVQLQDDASLTPIGKGAEDVAMAQLRCGIVRAAGLSDGHVPGGRMDLRCSSVDEPNPPWGRAQQ
jgi:hypothetical protein